MCFVEDCSQWDLQALIDAARYLNVLIASDEWSFMLISGGFISVGTFCFLSGFFLGLTVSRQKRSGPIAFIVGVIRRYIRTVIPMFFIIMCLYLTPRFVLGPDTKSFFQKLYKDVGHHWWHLLLMIRNFVEITIWDVLPHTWYLSTDFQLFVISLAVLLAFKRVMAKLVSEYYIRPYYHAVCYFSGCMTYLLMDDFKERNISKIVQVIGWLVSLTCALVCVFMKLAWYRSPNPTSEALKLLASFVDRILWAVSLSWITLACSSGRGGETL
ncbi:O-acyltransferase like protein-like [Rhipicephalus sanguineus]|uniref:O-acyltransferase like protein-like n=1 Tax=Rhipicephalus sanguineus TaxID=34632 RepID=UPI0020C2D384|nr:O-acyltransferase like protein-like [Rhipicephalus sanguineus]